MTSSGTDRRNEADNVWVPLIYTQSSTVGYRHFTLALWTDDVLQYAEEVCFEDLNHPSTLPKLTVPSTWLLQAWRARSAYVAVELFTAETSGLMSGCKAVGLTNKPAWFLLCYALVWVYPTRLGSFIMLCICKDFGVIYFIDYLDNERFCLCVCGSVL